MGLLEELLKRSKDHAQSVIIVLIGLIVVGSIGGGIWIHNLQGALEDHDKLAQQELQEREENYDAQIANFKLRLGNLEDHIQGLEAAIQSQSDVVDTAIKKFEELSSSRSLNRKDQESVKFIAHDLQAAQKTTLNALSTVTVSVERTEKLPGFPVYATSPMPRWLLILIIVLICTVIGWLFLWVRRRLRSKPNVETPPQVKPQGASQ